MNNILSTFKEIARLEGMTISKLETEIGASKGVLSRAIREGTDIQAKWLLSLAKKYPRYNAEWMLTGKGAIVKLEHHHGDATDPQYHLMEDQGGLSPSQRNRFHSLLQTNSALKDANEALKETKELLKIRIGELEEKIKELEK